MKFLHLSVIFCISYATCNILKDDKYYASSVSDMISLQNVKHFLLTDLELYAKELKSKMHSVKKVIIYLETQLKSLEKSIKNEEYQGFNYLSTLRRQHLDWSHLLKFMTENVAKDSQDHIQAMRYKFPIEEDYIGALISIFLLMDVYLITPEDFAKGLLNGTQYNSSLDALDCYALGQFALKREYYEEAQEWFHLSRNYLSEIDESQRKLYQLLGLDPIRFSKLYARSLLKNNKKVAAWSALNEALLMAPQDISLYRELRFIDHYFYTFSMPSKILSSFERQYDPNLKECCRGEFEHPKGLSCYYDFGVDPFLLLAPFKVELLNQNPYVAVYHDIIYDSEIEDLKLSAVPKIRRSLTYDNETDRNVAETARTSNGVFLDYNSSYAEATVTQRVRDATNFIVNYNNSDNLQVMNYGLGGQYAPHYDWFGPEFLHLFEMGGDRIATVLFYLSDVQQGGATVFPTLELTYFPVKGSALIFHNLDNTMNGNLAASHSGCPVLFGSKWAAAKWINSFDQMFRFPCLPESNK